MCDTFLSAHFPIPSLPTMYRSFLCLDVLFLSLIFFPTFTYSFVIQRIASSTMSTATTPQIVAAAATATIPESDPKHVEKILFVECGACRSHLNNSLSFIFTVYIIMTTLYNFFPLFLWGRIWSGRSRTRFYKGSRYVVRHGW